MTHEVEALCFLAFVVMAGFLLMFIGISTKGINNDMKLLMVAEYAIIALVIGAIVWTVVF